MCRVLRKIRLELYIFSAIRLRVSDRPFGCGICVDCVEKLSRQLRLVKSWLEWEQGSAESSL